MNISYCAGLKWRMNESTEAKDFVAYAPPILGPRRMLANGFLALASKRDAGVVCDMDTAAVRNPCLHGTGISCGPW